jgi:hypothetical protein
MSTSFSAMKKSRQSSLEALTKELSKLNTTQSGSDEDSRFWKPTVDKAGNGMATIRFLPPPEGEDMPFVRVFSHGFKGPTGLWYIENSLTTLGKQDPVSEYNTQLWNSTTDDASPARKQVREQKRRLNFISNILVVKDSANPANEGKVFLYQYGKKIFDKINETMNPQFDDEKPMNPFDFWEGANFKLKIRQVEGYRNYDKSEFEAPAPMSDDDSYLENVWKQQHSLQEFLDPSKFKSYDELKQKLVRVLDLGGHTAARVNATKKAEDTAPWDDAEPAPTQKAKSAPKASESFAEDDDETMEFFKNLADK